MTGQRGVCVIEDCERPHAARGWCQPHWKRWKRWGDPEGAMPSYDERFEMRICRPTDTDCWLWTGKLLHGLGYGIFWCGREVIAHRYAYQRAFGPIPDGHDIDHLCHNYSGCIGGACLHRRCVRPDHLDAVLPLVNRQRSHLFGANRMTCPAGHPYDEVNTYWSPSGGRSCRECARERDRRRVR